MSANDTDNSATLRHLVWIDWLRFGAAFLVVMNHARSHWPDYSGLDAGSRTPFVLMLFAMSRLGLQAVVLFFILSGFLVGGGVISRLRSGTFVMRDYAIDRFTRIYVPLVPALLFTGIVMSWIGKPAAWGDFLGNLLSLQGVWGQSFAQNGALWTLPYEVWLYVFMGCIAWWHLRASAMALSGIALCCGLLVSLGGSLPWCWFLGAAASVLIGKRLSLTAISALCIAGLFTSMLAVDTKSPTLLALRPMIPSMDVALIILGGGLALLVPWLAARPPKHPVLQSIERTGTSLASWSYTLYLTHSPALHCWDHFANYHTTSVDASSLLHLAAKLAFCCLVAWVLYLPFEKQTHRVRRWLKGRASHSTTDLC